LFYRFPRVVRFWVSFPFYEVLKSPRSPVVLVIHNGFYLEFFLASYQVRRWSRVIGSVLISLAIRSQQTCVEDVMPSENPRRADLRVIPRIRVHRGMAEISRQLTVRI
jgi:hypothetical protein